MNPFNFGQSQAEGVYKKPSRFLRMLSQQYQRFFKSFGVCQ
jgi:hypothetical protein